MAIQGQVFFPLLDSSYRYSLSLEVWGRPKPPQGRPSFHGRWLLGRSSPWTISGNTCYHDKQMLHVQEDGGVCGPSSSPLRCGFCFVLFSFQSFWVVLGYATTRYRSACLLVVFEPVEECYGVENGVHLPLSVLIEGKK